MANRRTPNIDQTLQKLRPTAQTRFSPIQEAGNSRAQTAQTRGMAEALDAWSTVAAKGGAIAERNRQQEAKDQMARVRAYQEMFEEQQGDSDSPVTEDEVLEAIPELQPEVAQTITRNMGSQEARKYAQGRIEELLQDNQTRLNTDARLEFYEKVRQEAEEKYGQDLDYASGFLEQLDSTLKRYETQFIQETASHQRETVRSEFRNRVTEAIAQDKSVDVVDQEYDQNSPIGRRERKGLIVESYMEAAIAAQDPSLLDQIPDKYLNAQTKQKLPEVRRQVRDSVFQEVTQQDRVNRIRRAEGTRRGKTAILDRIAAGETINPMDYRHNPALYEYASEKASQDPVNETRSVYNRESFKTNIMRAGFTGNYLEAFEGDPQFQAEFGQAEEPPGLDDLREHVLGREDLSPGDQRKLLEDLPSLMEGQSVMQHYAVKESMDNILSGMLNNLENSANAEIRRLMEGTSLRADTMRTFKEDLRGRVMDHFEDNGEWPRGSTMREITQSATDRAVDLIERRTSIEALNQGTTSGRPDNPRGGATGGGGSDQPQEQPEARPEDVEWLRSNNTPENRDSFQQRFGYLPEGVE